MDMDIRISVGICNLLIIDLAEPVVCRHRAGITQDQAAYGIGHCGIFLYTPVLHLYIAVYHVLIVQQSAVHAADLLPLLPVKNISLCYIRVAGLLQHMLHAVLDLLHRNASILHPGLKISRHAQGKQF